ncbi:bestrophin-like domain [Spirilliplanes yamanashiensis]|uniref:Membrane protein n=1 Tax=Spirilliplanes yamanashiensis TaxID=42233 RepID=A0A8J3YCA6_9ACTN|nr:DUF4239 domain-containing protein [Spirilliplanes yamanashiensis]MDP9816579.1 hypothetical protein [Spirilliplanes yamanashiensis]GIJ06106.1 membrane protein [Spirilliplanes yamanashiensis]
MELWLVRDVPAWLVGAVLILGLPAITLGLDAVIHRRLPHQRLGPHNEVTGVIVSVVGVAYAIVIGLCVVSLWEGYTAAKDTSRDEAAQLTALVPAAAVFGPDVQRTISDEVVRYESDIITDWEVRREEGAERRRTADLAGLTATVGALQPVTEPQRAFVRVAVERIGAAEVYHHDSDAEADDQRMSSVMWLGVLLSTAAIMAMSLFFGLADNAVRRILLALSSAVIATNLFLIIEMNYPYYGSFAVRPDAYEQVVEDLRRER